MRAHTFSCETFPAFCGHLQSWVLSAVGLSWAVLGGACLCVTTLQQVWLAGLVRNPFWTDPTMQTRHVEAGMMYLVAQALTLGQHFFYSMLGLSCSTEIKSGVDCYLFVFEEVLLSSSN